MRDDTETAADEKDVIAFLNESLTAELAAINQYMLHAKMCEDWGYRRLGAVYRSESIGEMHHAETLMERILLLDGMPDLQHLGSVHIGKTVEDQLRLNLELEQAAVDRYRRGIKLCLETGDACTRDMLERILVGEEQHLDWFKTQQSLIDDIGIELYLQTMVGEIDEADEADEA